MIAETRTQLVETGKLLKIIIEGEKPQLVKMVRQNGSGAGVKVRKDQGIYFMTPERFEELLQRKYPRREIRLTILGTEKKKY